MFGDTILIGHNEANITNGRFTIPKYTNVSIKERLYFLKCLKYVCLFSENELIHLSDMLLPKIKKNYSYEIYNKFIRVFYSTMLSSQTVKTNNRILIPPKIRDEYNFKNKVIIEGCNTHLKLFSNNKDFEEYTLKKSHN